MQNESKSKNNCRLRLATKKSDISPKPDKSVGPVTGGVRLNNLYTKGVISKFRPGKPRSLAFEFNMITLE